MELTSDNTSNGQCMVLLMDLNEHLENTTTILSMSM